MQRHSLTREVIRIAWPMVISELGDSLYSIADTYFVSKIGTIALAAVSVGSYLSWLFFVIVALFSTGILIYTAQSYGAGAIKEAKCALGESILFGILVPSTVALIVYHSAPSLIGLIVGPNEKLINVTFKYFSIRILGLPILAVALIMDSAVRAVGATKLSMIAILSSAFLNIALDPVFIFGLLGFPKMGVAGAALATVISIAYIIPLEFVFLKKLSLIPLFSLRPRYVIRVTRVGLPAATERLIFSIGNNAYISFIARCGNAALAAHQIGIRIESFIYMPGFAFSVAASALVGQRIGAGNIEEGKHIGMETAKIATILMTILGIAVAITATYLVTPFSPDENVAELATLYLILAGLSEPGLALVMTLSGAIRGGGNTLIPMVLNASGLYLFRVLPAAILTGIMGVIGAWIAMFIDVYLRGLIFLMTYRKFFIKLVRKVI